MLFWHLAQCRVAHIHPSMLRFSLCEQLQNSYRYTIFGFVSFIKIATFFTLYDAHSNIYPDSIR